MFIRLAILWFGLVLTGAALADNGAAAATGSDATSQGTAAVSASASGQTVVCPTCGRRMPAAFNFCSNCGANLQKFRAMVAATSDPTAATATTTTSTTTTTLPATGATAASASQASATFATPAPLPAAPEKKQPSLFSLLFPSSPGPQGSALTDKPIPLKLTNFPDRPRPLIEIGQDPFLGTGQIGTGFTIPTGAVWQPEFIVYGTARLALQTFDDGTHQITEFANRLDLFGNLYLTPTERILIGFRPLDRQYATDYSGYRFDPRDGPQNDINAYVTTLFFEGNLTSLFPGLDPQGTRSIDYNFSIGRQPLNFEDGIMINDDLDDAIGINKTSIFALGASAVRTSAIVVLHDLHRNDNLRDDTAALYGLFTTADYAKSTVDFDLAFVSAGDRTGGDGFYVGAGATQRIGLVNSTFRVNSSVALDRDTPAVSTGTLLLGQFSTTLPTKDIVYLDLFWGIDQYASAARGPDLGGPLSNIGLLFAAQGLGAYGAPIGDQADSSLGAAIGIQKFIGGTDRQLTLELGGRIATSDHLHYAPGTGGNTIGQQSNTGTDTGDTGSTDTLSTLPDTVAAPKLSNLNENEPTAIALAARYQMKLDQHKVLIFDAFVGFPQDRSTAYGFRSELLLKF